MKRLFFVWMTLALCSGPVARAQDAATQERLDKLSGRVEDLIAAQESLSKQMNELRRELQSVRELASKPQGDWATREAVQHIAESVREVDRKRVADSELVQKQLEKIRQALDKPLPPIKRPSVAAPKDTSPPERTATPEKPQQGVEHVVKQGETLSGIVAACREQHIKVTKKQILDANPGLNPDLLIQGKKIFIPAVPQP
jgi:LysM repeat protein/outer membrane murein-binding lipoprotein Lpp